MFVFRCVSGQAERELWGRVYKQGEVFETDDAKLVQKLRALTGEFEEVKHAAKAKAPEAKQAPEETAIVSAEGEAKPKKAK